MFTAKTGIDLPRPPENLIKHISNAARQNQDPFLTYKAGDGIFECTHINQWLLLWAVTNLPVYLKSVFIQTIRAGDFDVHVDGPTTTGGPREFNLMYIIESGGEHVTTSFYKTTDELLALAGENFILPEEYREKIATFEFQPGEWILMNNQCFHSVNGITGLRIGLSISFYKHELSDFLKNIVNEAV